MASEGFVEPCLEEILYTEGVNKFGVRYIAQECMCGKDLGSHVLKTREEIRYAHCESVWDRETAIENMGEWVFCHRKGITYSAYMGIREDGENMTDEEYAPIRERMEA